MIHEDTICAVSTPHGVGGVAMIRISGTDAIKIVDTIWRGKKLAGAQSHTAHLGTIIDDLDIKSGEPLDQAVATVFIGPHSFTGEDVVELCVHGSLYVQERLIKLLIAHGCRMAGAGEFTRRAFASGRMDLAQAEAVADVIASTSKASHRIALCQMRGVYSKRLDSLRSSLLELCTLLELELDFSEEDVEFASRERLKELAVRTSVEIDKLCSSFARGNAIKNGVPVAIVGKTNVGKSTLLNTILGEERAIVSNVHGTTRDFIEDTINIGGTVFRITDTAGLRSTDDEIENIGIKRAVDRARKARIVIWMIDVSDKDAITQSDISVITDISSTNPDCTIIPVINKCDISTKDMLQILDKKIAEVQNNQGIALRQAIHISAGKAEGIDSLTDALVAAAGLGEKDDILVTNLRHYESLKRASESISRVIDGLNSALSGDLVAQDLRETIDHLSAITARVTSADILQNIFSRFCIGK